MPLPTTSNTTNPRSHGYHIRIEDNFWQVVSAPDRPFDLVAQAGRIPTAREFISDPEDVPRSEHTAEFGQVDFSGGEGLDFAHRPDNTPFDRTRFWASDGLEVMSRHGDVQKIQLERSYTKVSDATDYPTTFAQSQQMVKSEGSLFVAGGVTGSKGYITRIDDPTGSPTITTEDPQGAGRVEVFSLAVIDEDVYATTNGNGIYKRDANTDTWSSWVVVTAGWIWGVKGRIVGATNSGQLREITASGATDLVNIGDVDKFRAAADAGAAILVGATNGYVYALADVEGSLTLRAQTKFQDEDIVALGSNAAGVVLIGTRQGSKGRLYMAELGGSYTLQNTQLLREWDVAAGGDANVAHITFTRDVAYLGFENPSNDMEVWKFDVATSGLFRVGAVATFGLGGMAVVNGHVCLCNDQHDVWVEQFTFQASGWLISPLFDHFSPEDKVWAAAKFFGVDLPSNTQAKFFYSTNPEALEDDQHASWKLIKTLNNTTGVDDVETILTNAKSRWITLKVELSTSNNSFTPQVRGYSVRSYAGEGDWVATIPINVSDVVVRPGHKPTKVPGLGSLRYDTLKTYEGNAATLVWLYQDETFEGTVEQVGLRSPLQPRRGGNLMVAEVKFIGRRV